MGNIWYFDCKRCRERANWEGDRGKAVIASMDLTEEVVECPICGTKYYLLLKLVPVEKTEEEIGDALYAAESELRDFFEKKEGTE